MSINNFGSTVGSFVGAALASVLNISSGSFDNLLLGIAIQVICIFIPIGFLFLIPKEATGLSQVSILWPVGYGPTTLPLRHSDLLKIRDQNDIRKNPTFRSQFHEMCAKVGVDPLASNKGFWAELLGIGDFYYELEGKVMYFKLALPVNIAGLWKFCIDMLHWVQIVEICLATRPHNGGLINLQELCKLLRQRRKSDREAVSEDDCLRAISKLKVLGSGFEVISVGKKKLVRSVPTELNKDHNQILELAQAQGFVTVDEVEKRLSWTSGHAIDALDTLLDEGLAMIDDGHRDGKRLYWFPCVSSITSSVGADL
ncbi:hypothetical protein JRO89_XS15G0154400 [Xanthoceras sorbifolium]|uniref:Vacuolar protein sorting-associated protein n=1 Tax=Xanthoceras sorbifolium TaxID=99658 RepID=A0ABQ8H2C4_9ROSI|nr:hypothetical protein JRO89_XS15G0154400 [Xanthoceras sorbifolium]